MRKILITGSGPYLLSWWKAHEHKLKEYEIHSINTSVLITKENCERWWHSSDFYYFHPEIPQNIVSESVKILPNVHEVVKYERKDTSGTMFFNALQHLINEHIQEKNIQEVNVVCCDLIYEGDETHFYKGGTPDPLRLGEELLLANINFFKEEYKKRGVGLYNLCPEGKKSLLNFERKCV